MVEAASVAEQLVVVGRQPHISQQVQSVSRQGRGLKAEAKQEAVGCAQV